MTRHETNGSVNAKENKIPFAASLGDFLFFFLKIHTFGGGCLKKNLQWQLWAGSIKKKHSNGGKIGYYSKHGLMGNLIVHLPVGSFS